MTDKFLQICNMACDLTSKRLTALARGSTVWVAGWLHCHRLKPGGPRAAKALLCMSKSLPRIQRWAASIRHVSTRIFIYRQAACTHTHVSLYVNTNIYLHTNLCEHVCVHLCVSIKTLGHNVQGTADSNLREKCQQNCCVTPSMNMMSTWNWKESLSISDPECLYHTMPSLMSSWVKEVVGEAALPSGKSCHESAGPSAGVGTRSTTSPGKSKDEQPGHNLWENTEEHMLFHQLMSWQEWGTIRVK